VAIVATFTLAVSCSASESADDNGSAGSDPTTITGAIATTINPDPDVYFAMEGVMITSAVYDPLVRQLPDSQVVEGVLAESWTISDNGLTYTFTLRPDLTFADGSPLVAADVRAAFQRRLDVAQIPASLIAGIASVEAPSDDTVVIELSAPDHTFLLRLGGPWGPVVTNPEVLAENAGDDFGQTFLRTNSAGSGPYVIDSFAADEEVVLVRNENYWGEPAPTERIELKVISSASTAQLQVEQGDLDFAQYVSPESATSLEDNQSVSVVQSPGINMAIYQINTAKAPFDDPEFRNAVVSAIPFDDIVSDVYGKWATQAVSYGPVSLTPSNAGLELPSDQQALDDAIAQLPGEQRSRTFQLAYLAADNGGQARITTYVGDALRSAGLEVEEIPLTEAALLEFFSTPETGPDMVLTVQPSDGGGPDNWFRQFYSTTGPLNWNGAGTPEGDAIIDGANATPVNEDYPLEDLDAMTPILDDQLATFPVADVPNIWIVNPELRGMETMLGNNQAFLLTKLSLDEG